MRAERWTDLLVLGFLMAMFLAGCGGSGGGSSYVEIPKVEFLSPPSFSVKSAFTDEPVETVISIAIAEVEGQIPAEGVKLFSYEQGTSSDEYVINLHDDGSVANGDDIAGDGVYSARLSLSKSVAGEYFYRVAVDTGIVSFSDPVKFTVLKHLTEQEIRYTSEQTVEAFQKHFPAAGSTFTQMEFGGYKAEVVAEILSLPDVIDAQISADGNSIVTRFRSGTNLSIDFVYALAGTGFITQGGASRATAGGDISTMRQAPLDYFPQGEMIRQSASRRSASPAKTAAGNQEGNAVGSYRVLALSPFQWRFAPWDAGAAYSVLQNSSYPVFAAEAPVVDSQVTVENFKKFSNYGIILINSHGSLDGTTPLISTGEEATWARQEYYQADIAADRIIISQMVNISILEDGLMRFDGIESRQFFKIAPSFITQYNKNLPNSLVYLGSCNGLATDLLADAFIAAGAGAVAGFTDTVTTGYNYTVASSFLLEMVKGRPVKEAIDIAGVHEADDSGLAGIPPAVFAHRGNGNIKLELAGIRNGGFEQELKFWATNGGDARVISKLASLKPQEGSYMAILSSGLGSVTDSDAMITQQIKIPVGVDYLSFDYNVISEEPMDYVGTEYDDKFRALLIDENGNEIELAFESVNTSTWHQIAGNQADGGMFDGGDETAFETGWTKVTHQITSLAGQTITLKFRVWDEEDDLWDTAALLDGIKLH